VDTSTSMSICPLSGKNEDEIKVWYLLNLNMRMKDNFFL